MAKTLTGVVTSNAADKTITVTVTSRQTHPIYKKQYTVTRKYIAHDANNEARQSDTVRIVETRPISKRKSFVLDRIEKRSVGSVELKEEVNAEVSKDSMLSVAKLIEEQLKNGTTVLVISHAYSGIAAKPFTFS